MCRKFAQTAEVLFRKGDGLLLALGFLVRLPLKVDIEVHLERRNRGERHELRRGVLNETEVLVRLVDNRHHETEMLGVLERLRPFRLGSSTEIHFDPERPLVIIQGTRNRNPQPEELGVV